MNYPPKRPAPHALKSHFLSAEGRLTVRERITHRFRVDEAREAYDLLMNRSEPFLAMAIDW